MLSASSIKADQQQRNVIKCASESPEKSIKLNELINTPATTTAATTTTTASGIKSFAKNFSGSCGRLNGGESNGGEQLTPDSPATEMNDVFDEFDGLLHKDTKNFTNTMKMLNCLRKSRQLCDLILQLDDDSQDIYCHQIILACNSKFFMEIFTNIEQENNMAHANANGNGTNSDAEPSVTPSSADGPKGGLMKKKHLQELVVRNKNSSHTQLLFCLSDYLKNFLKDTCHHHYAKLNSAINHNSHYHHHHHHHPSNSNYNIDSVSNSKEDLLHYINHNNDYEALKICIDYMYTSQLKVPSHLIPHVYTLAYHLSFDNIVNVCAQYLTKHLNVDNCLGIRSIALDEKLIQASAQCIEKNFEYILQINPRMLNGSANRTLSSSLNSLTTTGSNMTPPPPSSSSTAVVNGGAAGAVDMTASTSSLSCSMNLAHNEFNHLPRINIELVGLKPTRCKLPNNIHELTELCMSWLVNEVVHKKTQNVNDLCDNLNMLYINRDDQMLHDCVDMDTSDANFNDYIDDYQKKHNLTAHPASLANNNGNGNNISQKSSNSASSTGTIDSNNENESKTDLKKLTSQTSIPGSGTSSSGNKMKTFKITDQELNDIGQATPIKLKTIHDNEIICTYQLSSSRFITICTLTGRLVTLSVHVLNNTNGGNGNSGEINPNSPNFYTSNSIDSLSSLGCDVAKSDASCESARKTATSLSESDSASNKFSLLNGDQQAVGVELPEHEPVAKMRLSRCSHGLISYENKLYMIGGYDRGECLNTCETYDPKTNKLESIQPMENRRGRAAIVWLESEKSIYAMGGSDGHVDLNSIERYDMTTRSWTTVKFDFDLIFSNLGAIACADFIYLVGLKQPDSVGVKSQSRTYCVKYDPKKNEFTRLSQLNYSRSQGALVWNMSNLIYVFGGYDQIKCLNSCEAYNFQEDSWTVLPNMLEPRRGCGAAYHKKTQTVYIVGGTNGSKSLKSIEIYDTRNKKWTIGPDLNFARANVSVSLIGDILFAVGGYDGKSFLRSIEYLNCSNLNNGWSLYHKPEDFEFIA